MTKQTDPNQPRGLNLRKSKWVRLRAISERSSVPMGTIISNMIDQLPDPETIQPHAFMLDANEVLRK